MKERFPLVYLLPRFSVTRPVTVIMVLLAILVVGTIAYRRIPLSLEPEGREGSWIGMWILYSNASARDIEQSITRKIEDAIGTVPDVKQVRSYSRRGYSSVSVQFHPGADMKVAYGALQDRLDRVKPDLPDDVTQINLRRWDQDTEPILEVVVTLPPGIDDVFYRIDNFVRPALQRIEGVGNVEISGLQRLEIAIALNDRRMRSHGIDSSAVVDALRTENLAVSGGYVFAGDRKVYVRSLGRFTGIEEMGMLMIGPVHRLRLRDIAEISIQPRRWDSIFRVNQKPSISLEVVRESTANIERISREVRETLAELMEHPQLKGAAFDVVLDQGEQVREAINNLKYSGLWGGLFAAIVIFSFLRSPRMTGILTLSIPLSLLCTIIVLFFMGWTLNIATMMGLLLSLGMVIDNSIVIVENIYRRQQEGFSATRASIVGTGEVGLAVVMATLTSVVVFLPLVLMSDGAEFSFWMVRIGIPVIASLLASLGIALVFVPLAAERLSRGHRHHEPKLIAWLRHRYLVGLRWALTHRMSALLIALLAVSTMPYAKDHLQRYGSSRYHSSDVRFYFDMPSGTSREEAEAFFSRVEDLLLENAELYGIVSIESSFRDRDGRVRARLIKDPNNQWYEHVWDTLLKRLGLREVRMDRYAIEEDFRTKFEVPPGVEFRGSRRNQSSGEQDESTLRINLYGEDTDTLIDLAAEASRRLRTIPGLTAIETDVERGRNELRVWIDRERVRQLGLNPRDVSNGISSTMRGREVGRYHAADGRELSIRIKLGDRDDQRLDDLRSMTFRTDAGVDVPLESLAAIEASLTLGQIRREDRQTTIRMTARAPRVDARRLFEAVDLAMQGFEMPRGYRWDKGSYYSRYEQSDRERKFAVTLAVAFVFLLMGVLFESFVLPLAVIAAVPFSFLGVYWTLYLTDTPMNHMAMIGTVILVGVVVNNAIVLVDLTSRLRTEGRARFDALLEAGRHRFRPIMMTTLTTVFGLVPMAVGNSQIKDMPYGPLGRTMIGGLLAATVLTLVIVPLLYTLLDDFREHVARIFRLAFAGSGKGEAVAGGGAGAATGVGRAGPVD
jgi:HAE1 family hydrophobic/amphiphilic exporter-1